MSSTTSTKTALLFACALLLLALCSDVVGAVDNVRRWSLSYAVKSAASRDFPALFSAARRCSKTGEESVERRSTKSVDGEASATSSSQADPLNYRGGGETATAARRRRGSRSGGGNSNRSKTAAQRRALTERAEEARKTKKKTATTAKKNVKQQQTKGSTKKAAASAATATATTSASAPQVLGSGSTEMPTLFFAADETDLDRYAACLAAAEGLRRARDASATSSRVKRALGSIDAGRMDPATTAGGSGGGAGTNGGRKGRTGRRGAGSAAARAMRNWSPAERSEFDTLRTQYAVNTARMVQGLGLSVARFNELGKIVGGDAVLKERVMEQAYLYGMAAGLTGMERVPLIRGDDVGKKTRKGGGGGIGSGKKRIGGAAAVSADGDATQTQVETFARCLSEVEALRESNLGKLRASLGVDMLPPVICDPNVRSLLDPRVRAVCDAFPLQAEEVVGKFGLGSDEFNGLLDRLRSDPWFRWRVKRCMSKLVD